VIDWHRFAGLSAANDLGLTTQVPALDIVEVPRRAPRPLSGVHFVDRSARQGRVSARLRAPNVALQEVLSDGITSWRSMMTRRPVDSATYSTQVPFALTVWCRLLLASHLQQERDYVVFFGLLAIELSQTTCLPPEASVS
jgi:hypothetical protein